MPQLNRDILRDVFYEIVRKDGTFKNIDKFMMAGKEPFKLVLDICMEAKDVVIFDDKLVSKLPGIEYNLNEQSDEDEADDEKPAIGTKISTSMALFKPISIALASTLISLDIKSFTPLLIPMLKSIDREMKELYIACGNLKAINAACINIPNVRDGVTIKTRENFFYELKSFTIPCQQLTIIDGNFNEMCNQVIKNPHFRKKIRHLTIHGSFNKTQAFRRDFKDFAEFLSKNFPNLETLNVNFCAECFADFWKWNDNALTEILNYFPRQINGQISFKLISEHHFEINRARYPGLQLNDEDEYYKIFPITKILSLKLILKNGMPIVEPFVFHFAITVAYSYQEPPPNKVVFPDQKNTSYNRPPNVFKNQRSFKPPRNRFSR